MGRKAEIDYKLEPGERMEVFGRAADYPSQYVHNFNKRRNAPYQINFVREDGRVYFERHLSKN